MGSVPEAVPHPFDPLSLAEIETAITTVKKAHGDVFFNVVSLHEPRKAEMMTWLADPENTPRPARVADIVVIAPGGKVFDGLVDLKEVKIVKWEQMDGVQPIVGLPRALCEITASDKKIDYSRGAYGRRAHLPYRS